MRRLWSTPAWVILVILLAGDIAHAQFAAPCRAPAPQAFRGGGPSEISDSGGFLELVPSICVSERYDSNVFFRGSTPGLEREDYVTSVNPMLRINQRGDYSTGSLEMSGVNETYVKNSGLNFIGSNATLGLNLDNTIKRVLPSANLSITDAVGYSPLPPGFVNPVAGANPSAPDNIQDVFAQGLLSRRSNRVSNNGRVSVDYNTSSWTKVNASYSHAILRFLDPSPNVTSLFDTTTQTGTMGGIAQVSGVDQLAVRYSFFHSEFERGSGSSFQFKAHTAAATWSRVLSPNLTFEGGGGWIFREAGKNTYAANATLVMNLVTTRATISYNRFVFPGYIDIPTVLVGDVVSLSVVQQIDPQWQLRGVANYSHSSGSTGMNAVKIDSYGSSVDLTYLVSSIWSTALGYSYLRFDREVGGLINQFDRHVVMFSVRASWGL